MTQLAVVDLLSGSAAGPLLVLDEPLSLWGGLDAETGRITDVHHPQHGQTISRSILVMPFGRGSSSASSVLAEAIRLTTAPAGFVLSQADEILALGALVGQELYGTVTPIVLLDAKASRQLVTGTPATISPGTLQI